MNPTDRIIKRILEVDNFQNMACVCDDFADFVTEILEWGVDHIAGVDFFDSYKSYRDFTFNLNKILIKNTTQRHITIL